jgi:RimK family alpha-L-glutamate ligase
MSKKFYHIVQAPLNGPVRADYILFAEACNELGIEYIPLYPEGLGIAYSRQSSGVVMYNNEPLDLSGSLLFRSSTKSMSSMVYNFALDLYRGVTHFAQVPSSIARRRGKLGDGYILNKAGVATPATLMTSNTDLNTLKGAVAHLGGQYPVIIKPNQGTKGIGVVQMSSSDDLEQYVKDLPDDVGALIVQECITNSHGKDIRAVVVGDQVVASVLRSNDTGDFRSNIAQGATASAYKMTPAEQSVAARAVQALGLEYGGVDLMFGEDGLVVTEVNSPCDLSFIHPATGISVPHHIIKYLLEKHKNQHAEKQ